MEIGSVVRFSSDPRSFVVEDEYCENPDCACHLVWLLFTAIDHPEGPRSKPLSFRIGVDLETWQERKPPARAPQIDRRVAEFLSQLSASRKNEFRTKYQEGRRRAQRIADYRVDPQEILSGVLVSFSDVLTGNQSLSSGGRSFAHRFTMGGREYLVEDLYCANPACDCQALHVQFWEGVYSSDGEKLEITMSFLGRVTFAGQLEVEESPRCTRREAQRILSAWRKAYQCDMELYERRYQCVQEIGRRCLAEAETRAAGNPSLTKGAHRFQPDTAANSSNLPNRIGRNAPCPCGSGKKFKRCCAARDARTPLAT